MAEDQSEIDHNKNAPFREPLIPAEVGEVEIDTDRQERIRNKIMTLPRYPHTLIRNQSEVAMPTMENQLEYAGIAKKLFEELGTEYGIDAVPFNIILGGKKDAPPETWVKTEKIEGTRLRELIEQDPPDELVDMTSDLYTKLAHYLSDKRKNGEYFLSDVYHDRQFMYGSIGDNEEKKLYMTDLDFYLAPALVDTDLEIQTGFIRAVNDLTFTLNKFTTLTGKQLDEARTELTNLLDSINPLSDDNKETIELLKVAIENKSMDIYIMGSESE
jgi:hypothetical protein